ncbi:peptide ABC transporter substrate-binding protein [Candidatus Bipolaricaulota bacterium]|nr:peptide ABC transporter substrate-binding protein [Candidatus Bipolaricaulota bacterium]
MRKILMSIVLVGLGVLSAWGGPALNNLIIGATQEPSNLFPWEGAADTKENVMALFNIGLTYFDSNGQLLPGLATEVPTPDNGRVWIVYDAKGNFLCQMVHWTLRDDAFWSDGVPITTDDVVFTYKVQTTPEIPVTMRTFSDLISDIRVLGPKDFIIVYGAPNLFYANIGGSIGLARFYDIAPAHVWEPIYDQVMEQVRANPDKAGDIISGQLLGAPSATGVDPTKVVGSGAFKFAEWQINQYIRFTRRDDFFLSAPGPAANYVQEVVVRFIVNQPTLISALLAGQLDATDDIALAGQDPSVLRQQYRLGVATVTPSGFIEEITFNLFDSCQAAADLLLGDKRTRQAIIQAIDRKDLADTVFPGAIVSNSFLVRGDVGFTDDLYQWPYDPSAARVLLAELGWADRDGDGVLERVTEDGRTVKFELHWVATTAAFRLRTGEILQEFLADVGIRLIPENLPGSVVFATEYCNHGSECTWRGLIEWAEAGGIGQAPADPISNELWAFDRLKEPVSKVPENIPSAANGFAGTNVGGWINHEFDQLRADALREFDLEKRAAIVVQMQKIFNEELPKIPLYERTDLIAFATGLVNYNRGTPVARTQFWNPWEWGWEQNGARSVR